MLVELSTELEPEDKHLTDLEVKILIQGLSSAKILKLGQIAKKYEYRSLMVADEILSEAIVVTASGQRKVPRNVPFVAFLAETMKSITSNEARKIRKKATPIDDDPENDPILNIADKNIDIEYEVAANQEIENIYELFKKDEDVTLLLMAKYDGLDPDEICEMENWNRTKYNSVQKRLRRGLNQHLPNGRET